MSGAKEIYHTSQCLRIAVRPPTTDLSGGNASEDSFTTSAITLAEVYAVDFQLDPDPFPLAVVPRLRIRSQGFERLSFLVTDWVGSETMFSALRRGTVRRIP